MSAVRNYVAVPFFDRVPPRVMDVVLITFDNIVERAQTVREAYHFFSNSVKKRGVEGPTHAEFTDWHERVKNGLVERPHSSTAMVSTLKTSFFNDVPIRAMAAVRFVCDAIALHPSSPGLSFELLTVKLQMDGIEGPSRDEFNMWYEEVKLGRFTRENYEEGKLYRPPHAGQDKGPEERRLLEAVKMISTKTVLGVRDVSPGATATGADDDMSSEVAKLAASDVRLQHARAIVNAAHQLNQAKLAAGHYPSSIPVEDTIVAEALREVLEADGDMVFTDPTSRALDAATALLIERASEEQEHRLLDILTMDMQVELCRKLATNGPA
ncbi:MAG: hypothetical protein PGN20_15235 [Agrobacterium cavarae]